MAATGEVINPAYTVGVGDDQQGEAPKRHQSKMLTLKRRLYTRGDLEDSYPRTGGDTTFFGSLVKDCCSCSCTGIRILHAFLGYFPIIGFLRRYKWRSDVISDLAAGVSVAFLMIPQGFAIGLLTSLPPIYGLYTTFFPICVYLIFGTSQHTSMGVNAIIAVLTASIIESQIDGLSPIPVVSAENKTEISSMNHVFKDSDEELTFRVGAATSVTLLTGIFLTVAGFLRLGFVTRYFSTAFIQGFNTATGIHILTSQISKLIHIKVNVYSGPGKLVKTYIDIFKNIGDANPADIVISVISLAFLLLVTTYINEKYRHKLKVPVPVQLILVTVATIISYFGRLEEKYGIAVIGHIPKGIPAPTLPTPEKYPGIVSQSLTVAVLTFTISISLSKFTAKLHDCEIDNCQEMVAYGVTNIASSFFDCFTACNAPPRAMILSAVGTKSALHAIIAAPVILIVLLEASPLLSALPVGALAAMVCAAIKNILLKVTDLPYLWRTSTPDFIVWVGTCLVSIFIDLDFGIIFGILISFLTIIVKSQLTSGTTGAVSGKEDLIHLNGNREGVITTFDNYVIFYFPSQLHFANCETFKNELFSKVFNPRTQGNQPYRDDERDLKGSDSGNSKMYKYVIIQCSALTYMDIDGAYTIKNIAELYKIAGVNVLLSNCPDYCVHMLERVDYFTYMPRDSVFYDLYDAVYFALDED